MNDAYEADFYCADNALHSPPWRGDGEAVGVVTRAAEDSVPYEASAALPSEAEALGGVTAIAPSITSFQQLHDMPEGEIFANHVLKGNSLADAYKLTFFEKLANDRADGARRAAVSRLSAKAHLRATPARAADTARIPSDILDAYRQLNPGLKDEDYRAHYRKYSNER